jgi:hypothetical protein
MPRTQDDFTTNRWRFRARKTRSRPSLRTRTPRRPSEKKYAAATKNSLPALNRKNVPLPPFFNQAALSLTNCLICDCVRVRASSAAPKPPNNSSKVLSLTIVRIEDQWFLSGNKLETFTHDTLNRDRTKLLSFARFPGAAT